MTAQAAPIQVGDQQDPFAVPMLFMRIGWMHHYTGLSGGDQIVGGGRFVAEHEFGHEIFNFAPFSNRVFGYFQPPRFGEAEFNDAVVNIGRLDAADDSDTVDGVLAIWVARSPDGGTFIVGWYKNATIYRRWQPPPPGSSRRHKETDCGYYVSARSEDAVLLSVDERVFQIPTGKNGMGQRNVWYADDTEAHSEFRRRVLEYVESRNTQSPGRDTPARQPRQTDLFKREQVEKRAIEAVAAYYSSLGYEVRSVEKDNVGWDLEATLGARLLRLEVKGLSGQALCVDLTPNEYSAMQGHAESFRLCVVCDALANPDLSVFSYVPDTGSWADARGRQLLIQKSVAARCSLS